jgi:hypothetical protein
MKFKTPAEFVAEFCDDLKADGVFMFQAHKERLIFKIAQRDKLLECSECEQIGGSV